MRNRHQFALRLLVAAATFFVALPLSAEKKKEPEWTKSPPVVTGSEKFRVHVAKALKLIEKKAPKAYAMIKGNVAVINQAKRSGMWAYNNPPTFDVADKTSFYSVTWCAASIGHDALHSKMYHDYLKAKGGPVPATVWTGQKAEIKCIAFQLDLLKKIGAPKHEVDYCATLDGTHSDVDKDGDYDWDDYFKRDW